VTGFFITGTDTGVGKTVVAAAIASYLCGKGVNVGVMKPAETGCAKRAGELVPSDAVLLKRASGTDDILGAVCPYRFSEPLAPSVAAVRACRELDPRLIVKVFRALSRGRDTMIVEGAGGLMVPLFGSYTYLDLAAELKMPIVIVGRLGLGSINHTLLTVEAAKAKGLDIHGIVLNSTRKGRKGVAEKTNPGLIKELSGVERVATLSYIPSVKRVKGGLMKVGRELARQGFFGLTRN
jgi:dethiobiotin synthetase